MESGSNMRMTSDNGQVLTSPESTAQLGTKFSDLHSRHEAWMEAMHSLAHQPLTMDSSGVHTVQFGETLRTIAERLIHMQGGRATRRHIDEECDRLIQLNKQAYPSLESDPDHLSSGLAYGGEPAWQLRTSGTPQPAPEEQQAVPAPLPDNGPLVAPLSPLPLGREERYWHHRHGRYGDDYHRHRYNGDPYLSPTLASNPDVGNGFLGASSVDSAQPFGGILTGLLEGGIGYHHHWYGHRRYPSYAYGGTGGGWMTNNADSSWNDNSSTGLYPNNYPGNNYSVLTSVYSPPITVGYRGARSYNLTTSQSTAESGLQQPVASSWQTQSVPRVQSQARASIESQPVGQTQTAPRSQSSAASRRKPQNGRQAETQA